MYRVLLVLASLVFTFSAHAESWTEGSDWVRNLPEQEQRIVLFLLRGKFETHIGDALSSQDGGGKQNVAQAIRTYAQGNLMLRDLATKTPDLQKLFSKETSDATLLIQGKISTDTYKQEQAATTASFRTIRQQVTQSELPLVINKYLKQLDATVPLLISYSRTFALAPRTAAQREESYPKEKLAPEEKRKIEKQLAAGFAEKYLKEMDESEEILMRLPQSQYDVALMSAGGSLNLKLSKWRKEKEKTNPVEKNSFAYIFGLTTLRLSVLAQRMRLTRIASCHSSEGMNLLSMADGKTVEPEPCRVDAYKGVEAKAIGMSTSKDLENINHLVDKWVTSTILYGIAAARIDGRYK
jgi:hypothetical protein